MDLRLAYLSGESSLNPLRKVGITVADELVLLLFEPDLAANRLFETGRLLSVVADQSRFAGQC
jgi:hypothetical protein